MINCSTIDRKSGTFFLGKVTPSLPSGVLMGHTMYIYSYVHANGYHDTCACYCRCINYIYIYMCIC